MFLTQNTLYRKMNPEREDIVSQGKHKRRDVELVLKLLNLYMKEQLRVRP